VLRTHLIFETLRKQAKERMLFHRLQAGESKHVAYT